MCTFIHFLYNSFRCGLELTKALCLPFVHSDKASVSAYHIKGTLCFINADRPNRHSLVENRRAHERDRTELVPLVALLDSVSSITAKAMLTQIG